MMETLCLRFRVRLHNLSYSKKIDVLASHRLTLKIVG